jgi:hypothetical protein
MRDHAEDGNTTLADARWLAHTAHCARAAADTSSHRFKRPNWDKITGWQSLLASDHDVRCSPSRVAANRVEHSPVPPPSTIALSTILILLVHDTFLKLFDICFYLFYNELNGFNNRISNRDLLNCTYFIPNHIVTTSGELWFVAHKSICLFLIKTD